MTPESSNLIGLAAAVYVTTCLVGAAVRWFHMCSPYDRKPRYYYPGRPFVTGTWLSSLSLLPYVLDPSSADAWFLARLYFLPVTLFHFVLNLVLCWFGALMNDPGVLACVQMLISGLCVVFLISALYPNRNRPMDDPVAKEGKKETQVYLRSIPKRKQAEILSAIRTVVESQQAFLDPHLTLQDVANRCGYNRTYIAGLVKSELGGFVTYVNGLRMEFVGDYLQKNPDATLGEAVDAAGFGSRSRYYDTKSKTQGNR
ncbi:MAG: hypothetical protein K6D54_04575 [Bacteroidales bacterium]|nr:hypothetical protein [Bacteroidales bacterium]